jgi:hypothetical protein
MTKEFILNEIKRTAKPNGGKPLGQQRFFQQTGIKQSDWIGKIWVRWSDALLEAGYSPNELQPAFDDTYLLDKLARFIRQLGHFPVTMEMRLHKRSNPEFPNAKGYERFGRKAQLAARIIDYCRDKSGFEDVISICESLSTRQVREHNDAKRPNDEYGFVYLLKSGRFYKIGRSNAAGRRQRELDIQLPEKASSIHVIKTDDPIGIEAYWHNRFAEKRVRRGAEWFNLDSAEVSAFRRRKFM